MESLFFYLGLIIGLLYAVSPYPEYKAGRALTNPRIASALGMLLFPIFPLMTAWEQFHINLDRATAILNYGYGAALATLIGILVVSLLIFGEWFLRCRRHPRLFGQLSSLHLTLNFLAYGLGSYLKIAGEERAKAEDFAVQRLGHEQLSRIGESSQALGAIMVAVAAWTVSRDEETRDQLIDRVLDCIESVVRQLAVDPQISQLAANYMEAVPIERVNAIDRQKAAYAWPESRISHFLILRRYNGRAATRPFLLAVDQHAQPESLLIGAPEAFVTGNHTYVDKRNLQFPAKLPKPVRTAIRTYLNGQKFRAFVSIPIVHRTGTVGILNIESSLPHILGDGENVRNVMVKALFPYCTLLSGLIGPTGARMQ